MAEPIDTNVIVRYLVESPDTAPEEFRGVFSFFEKLEHGERTALLTPLVVFQCYFVLTSYYGVPRPEAAEKLRALLSLKGLRVGEKSLLRACLETLTTRAVDLVDAYLAALCATKSLAGVYSFDRSLTRLGVEVLAVD